MPDRLQRPSLEAGHRVAVLDDLSTGQAANLPHGVLVFGPDRKVSHINRRWADMIDANVRIGETPEELFRASESGSGVEQGHQGEA